MLMMLIDNKTFFDQPVKNKHEAYEKPVEMSRNNDYITGNVLDYSYHQNYYKLRLSIDLLRQTKTFNKLLSQEKIEDDDGATMFLIAEKQQ